MGSVLAEDRHSLVCDVVVSQPQLFQAVVRLEQLRQERHRPIVEPVAEQVQFPQGQILFQRLDHSLYPEPVEPRHAKTGRFNQRAAEQVGVRWGFLAGN